MISSEDFHKPVKLVVIDEAKRTWHSLWLRKRERSRVLFAGYMKGISQSVGMNLGMRLSVDFQDSFERLRWRAAAVVSSEPEPKSDRRVGP